ncbi:hypothetical protein LBMAG18_04750 [Alphaproteobacteria bacterium]|nr:hypothetical protein LBMAG18_04750 [Alphaproteobacteria bacterium]
MKKDLIIKIGIGIFAVVFGYCVFWFFKAGQIEKQLNKFITENSGNVSVGELTVSGFPVAQKISVTDLKLTIPSTLFNKKQIIIKNIEAKASILSKDFVVTTFSQASINDLEKGLMAIEFSKDPEISFTVGNAGIQNLIYQDMGYRILDNEKNNFYSASRTSINIQSSVDDLQKTIVKITGSINEVQGFGVIDVYKSGLEKKIIEGIKTEEIVFGSAPPSSEGHADSKSDYKNDAKKISDAGIKQQDLPNEKDTAKAPANPANPALASSASAAPNSNAAGSAPSNGASNVANSAVPNPAANGAPPAVASNNSNPAPVTDPNQLSPAVSPQQVPSAITDSSIVKSNITIDIEYQISSNEQQPQVPSDPSQVKEMAIQSSKIVKINNIEFSNPLYKLFINGQLTILTDDNLPSGGVSLKVENIDNLVNQLVTQLGQMADQPKLINENRPNADSSVADTSVQDAYKNFLKRIAINLPSVNREISSKNPVTKENIAQFDIRREKNLDFIVNEISIHEILGKF